MSTPDSRHRAARYGRHQSDLSGHLPPINPAALLASDVLLRSAEFQKVGSLHERAPFAQHCRDHLGALSGNRPVDARAEM